MGVCEKLTAQGESKEAVNSASYEVGDSQLHVASEPTDGDEEGVVWTALQWQYKYDDALH